MNARKQLSAKKAWARLSERVRSGETFGFISCLALLYKGGLLSKAELVEQLNAAGITKDDLKRFRERRQIPADSNAQPPSL